MADRRVGFLGVYLLPFVKYPASPPAVGHMFTIGTRSQLYLALVGCSLILLGLAAYLAVKLRHRVGVLSAVLISAVSFLVAYGILIGLMPSLGDLAANVAVSNQFGYARAATEIPQPITNILSTPLTIGGKTIAPGQILYPGFDADVLWKFRWYSVINQLLLWTTIALAFGALLDRFLLPRAPRPAPERERASDPAEPAPRSWDSPDRWLTAAACSMTWPPSAPSSRSTRTRQASRPARPGDRCATWPNGQARCWTGSPRSARPSRRRASACRRRSTSRSPPRPLTWGWWPGWSRPRWVRPPSASG